MKNDSVSKENVVMVECPYCRHGIEAPDKLGVVFKCPNCRKELITCDIEEEKKRLEKARMLTEKLEKRESCRWMKILGIAVIVMLVTYIGLNHDIGNSGGFGKGDVCIVSRDFDAAINEEAAKAFIQAARDEDRLKVLELVGSGQTVHLVAGEKVRIIRNTSYGYLVQRVKDLRNCYVPPSVLRKE